MGEGVIVSNPKILVGKPIVKGTRISVELILERLAAGDSEEDIIDAYPNIAHEDILAALDFAAKTLGDITYFPEAENTH